MPPPPTLIAVSRTPLPGHPRPSTLPAPPDTARIPPPLRTAMTDTVPLLLIPLRVLEATTDLTAHTSSRPLNPVTRTLNTHPTVDAHLTHSTSSLHSTASLPRSRDPTRLTLSMKATPPTSNLPRTLPSRPPTPPPPAKARRVSWAPSQAVQLVVSQDIRSTTVFSAPSVEL